MAAIAAVRTVRRVPEAAIKDSAPEVLPTAVIPPVIPRVAIHMAAVTRVAAVIPVLTIPVVAIPRAAEDIRATTSSEASCCKRSEY